MRLVVWAFLVVGACRPRSVPPMAGESARVDAAGLSGSAPVSGKEVSSIAGDADRGKAIFAERRAACHGVRGEGNGPLGEQLVVKPRDLTRKSHMRRMSNAHLFRVIREGGKSVGLSRGMPARRGKLSEKEIADVVAYVRTLGQ